MLAAMPRRAHEALVELVAEGKDELMEEFFREGDDSRAAPDYRAA
jgi:elongation factor G